MSINTGKIFNYGAVDEYGGNVHTGKEAEFMSFISSADYICGHNMI